MIFSSAHLLFRGSEDPALVDPVVAMISSSARLAYQGNKYHWFRVCIQRKTMELNAASIVRFLFIERLLQFHSMSLLIPSNELAFMTAP